MLIGVDASRATAAARTGTENYSLRLIRALLELGTPHRFRLYTNRAASGEIFGPELAAGRADLAYIPFPRLWTHLRLSWEMIRARPDVLFVPAHVLPLRHPRASVATVHDLGYLAYPEAHRAQDRAYLDWSTRWNARHAAAVVADSQATRRDLIDAYAAEPDRVRVVYLGRDESLRPVHDPARLAAARARYGIRGPYFLYVGTLQPRKNLARLVAAFARLLARCDAPGADRPTAPEASGGQDGRAWPETACATTDLQLVLAGRRGWLFDELSGEVGRLELASRVVFPGYVDEADLPALYGGSLALVYPSLYEGFGMPVLEAQSCGVPVMTSNNSSLPEIAGDSALLVDPHDVDAIAAAMYRLLTDEGLRKELIRRGFANVQRFAWEKCARETLAVLEEVAASAQRGSARGGGHGA